MTAIEIIEKEIEKLDNADVYGDIERYAVDVAIKSLQHILKQIQEQEND